MENEISTLDEFLRAVEQTNRSWYLDEVGRIRLKGSFSCPRIEVGETRSLTSEFTRNVCPEIYDAADNHPRHNSEIRNALLKACGLSNG
jgi:hypothetical protein